MPLRLNVIVASTRPGRVGLPVARWFHEAAAAHGGFDPVLVDLIDFDLPVFDEPRHPRLRDYRHEHTRRWSASVETADAFVFVAPEYNYFPTPALVNALDYLSAEWAYKPAGFVGYGGVSGGLRAIQATKLLLTTLKIMPIPEQVTVSMVAEHVKEGAFVPTERHAQSAEAMLDELKRWAEALKPMRG